MERIKSVHPSYGMVSFHRVQSNQKDRFFGSDLKVNNYIELEIKHGEVERNLNQEWYYAVPRPMIKIKLTPNQFSELITSMNVGSGVPCTIQEFNNQRIEPDESFINKKDLHHEEFKDEMERFDKQLVKFMVESKAIIAKKVLTKEDQNTLKKHIDYIITEVTSNIPFYLRQFQEAMDKVVTEAKSELENAVNQKITNLGLQALQLQNTEEANKLLSS